ncbi:MAG TPA: lipopolysaccharide heptosyltransferase I [Methylophilus sp.]
MKKILLIKTSSLGDVIHNLPVVNDVLRHYPGASIDWVVEESFADIPRLHPKVNQVFTVAVRRWRKSIFKCDTWVQIRQFKQQLAAQQYDLVIDTQGLLKSALMTLAANGITHGYDRHSIREPLASCFYNHTHAISYQQHAVNRNRTLVALSGGYPPPTDAPDYGLSAQPLTQASTAQLPNTAYIVALHGTSRDSKLWPEAYWIALGQRLTADGLQMLLPWASTAEHLRAQRIASSLQSAVVLPKCSIAQLAYIISKAKAAIGVDTGLSHLAAALDIPTIALYTDTNPALTGVMAGAKVKAINLGNIDTTPSVDEVMKALNNL